jgi:hypothetical protein
MRFYQLAILGALLILHLILSGCKKEKAIILHQWTKFTIHQNHHGSGIHACILEDNTKLEFLAVFDHTAVYTSVDPINQHDINKLFGFSDCSLEHHKNSGRFGWNWNNNKLNIYAYCYVGSQVESKYITSVELNKVYKYSVALQDHKYIFSVDGHVVDMNRGCSQGFKYLLFPYFGGDETAPHDIVIKIKQL